MAPSPHPFVLPEYVVFLGALRQTFPAWMQQRRYSGIFIVSDELVWQHCAPAFFEQTGLPPNTPAIRIPPGEAAKTLATCERIWQAMMAARLDRQSLVINLGGGVVSDMGGFCAGTFKRGLDFVQAPTTLLAMTDAAIGGKLGIDFQGVKNAIGIFRNPAAVFVDPAFLSTLPPRERRSGFAEVIKHAWIGDPALRDRIAELPAEALDSNDTAPSGFWFEILRDSIAVKVRVVTEDPLEKGLRALLNFGHTIGHALESYYLETDAPLTHGEAVAIGMVCESRDSGRTPAAAIRRFFGHRPIPLHAGPELWALLLQDKKNASGAVRMAVPDAEPFSLQLAELTRSDFEQRLAYYNSLGINTAL